MNKPRFVYVSYIATTPEKLWQALTSGEFTEQYWFGRCVESDWRPGSKVTFTYDQGRKVDLVGQVLRCEPPRLLSYTFHEQSMGEPPSRVTFEIEPAQSMVKLTVTHEDFPPDSQLFERISRGWPAILSSLKSLLETGRALYLGPPKECSGD